MDKRKLTCKVFLGLMAVLMLMGCNSSKTKKTVFEEIAEEIVHKHKKAVYVMDNGHELTAQRLTAPNGKDYYVVRIDSVNYYQAYHLQKDGWVLPRMFGVFAADEHRSTTMPTLEMLLESPNADTGKDWHSPNTPIKLSKKTDLSTYLNESTETDIQEYWTSTRMGIKGTPQNYGMRYSKSTNTYEYRTMTYGSRSCALLLKDAQLVDDEVPDSMYLSPDGMLVAPVRYTAADGYDYYVVRLVDSLYTWNEAMAMEKDGWQLLRTQGTYNQTDDPDFINKLEHPTWHSYGYEPSLERFVGFNSFTRDGRSRQFDQTIPRNTWLATAINKDFAWMAGNLLYDEFKQRKTGYAILVKRIRPDCSDVKYDLGDGRAVQPQKITGMSGRTYYVVDPSDWYNFRYTGEEALALQRKEWHLITIVELEDMLELENSLDVGKKLEQYNHPLFFSAFPQAKEYYLKDTDDNIIVFEPYLGFTREVRFGLRLWVPNHLRYYYRVRLVYSPDDNKKDNEVKLPNDRHMYGLKGMVRTVKQERLNSTYYSDAYRPAGIANGFTIINLKFGRQGQLLRDHLDNILRYNNDGSFARGNSIYTTIERDKQQRLVKYIDAGDSSIGTITYVYNPDGSIKEEHRTGYDATYTYDENGQMSTEVVSETMDEGGHCEIERNFSYDIAYENHDEQGNWTYRVVVEKRHISNTDETQEKIYVDQRIIDYFE